MGKYADRLKKEKEGSAINSAAVSGTNNNSSTGKRKSYSERYEAERKLEENNNDKIRALSSSALYDNYSRHLLNQSNQITDGYYDKYHSAEETRKQSNEANRNASFIKMLGTTVNNNFRNFGFDYNTQKEISNNVDNRNSYADYLTDNLKTASEYYGQFQNESEYKDKRQQEDIFGKYGEYDYNQASDKIKEIDNRLNTTSKGSEEYNNLESERNWLNSNIVNNYGSQKNYDLYNEYKNMNVEDVNSTISSLNDQKNKIQDQEGRNSIDDRINFLNSYYYNDIMANYNLDDLQSEMAKLQNQIDEDYQYAYVYSSDGDIQESSLDPDVNSKASETRAWQKVYENKIKNDEAELEALKTKYNEIDMYQKYSNVKSNDNYNSYSQYNSSIDDNDYNMINSLGGMSDNASELATWSSAMGGLNKFKDIVSGPGENFKKYNMSNQDKTYDAVNKGYQYLTNDEKGIYNYIYSTQGKDSASEYIDSLNLTQRMTGDITSAVSDYTNIHPVIGSLASVGLSLTKPVGYLDDISSMISGEGIDQNSAANMSSNVQQAIRTKVSQKIDESGKWGAAGTFLYNTGMSMGDFLLTSAVTGGFSGGGKAAEALSLAIMGTGAASDSVISAKNSGMDDKTAFTIGTIAGAAEIITEKVSLETLMNMDVKGARYLFKNMLAEGSEEVGSDIINNVADLIVAGDKSEFRQMVQEYMSQGKSESESIGLAVADRAKEMGTDFLGGALSGGVMAGGALGINSVFNGSNVQIGSQINSLEADQRNNVINKLISNAMENGNENTVRLAQTLQEGGTLSDNDMGKLYSAVNKTNVSGDETLDYVKELTRQGINEYVANRIADIQTGNAEINQYDAQLLNEYSSQIDMAEYKVFSNNMKMSDLNDSILGNHSLKSNDINSQTSQNTSDIAPDEQFDNINANPETYSNNELNSEYGQNMNSNIPQEEDYTTELFPETSNVNTTVDNIKENVDNANPSVNNNTAQNVTPDAVVKNSGKEVSITGIKNNGNNITYSISDGSSISSSEIELSNEMEFVIGIAKRYSNSSANSMINDYNISKKSLGDSFDGKAFARAWNIMYNAGYTNAVNFVDASREILDYTLTNNSMMKAFEDGRTDKKTEVIKKQESINNAKKTKERRMGKVRTAKKSDINMLKKAIGDNNIDITSPDMNTLTELQKEATSSVVFLAKALGIDIVLYDAEKEVNVHGAYSSGTIYLNVNDSDMRNHALMQTIAHEVTHHIQEASPEMYENLKNYIIDRYNDSDQKQFKALVENKMDSLGINMNSAIDEVIADACEGMLKDGSAISELQEKHSDIVKAIGQVFQKILKIIMNALHRVEITSPEAIALNNSVNDMQELQKIWNEALLDASEYNVSNSDMKFSGNGNGYDGYSMSNNARDAYENGEKPLSKWKKADIISAIEEYSKNNKTSFTIDVLKKLNISQLKEYVLHQSSWHHTSMMYNKTDFYSVDEDYLSKLTDKKINEILNEGKTTYGEEMYEIITYDRWNNSYKNTGYVRNNKVYLSNGETYSANSNKISINELTWAPDDYIKFQRNIIESKFPDMNFTANSDVKFSRSTVRSETDIAKDILSRYNSTMKTEELAGNIGMLYSTMQSGDTPDQNIKEMSEAIAKLILENSRKNTMITPESRKVLDDIKSMRISLSDMQKSEIASKYGSFGKYRNSLMGKANLVNDGISLDSAWKQLSELHPELFSEDTNSQDQPETLANIVKMLSSDYVNDTYNNTDAIPYLAQEIVDGYKYTEHNKGYDSNLSTRTVLANALMSTASGEEAAELSEYKKAVKQLDEKEDILKKTKKMIKDLTFKTDSDMTPSERKVAIDKYQDNAKRLEASINYWDNKLMNLESTKVLKDLASREKSRLVRKLTAEANERVKAKAEEGKRKELKLRDMYQETLKKKKESKDKTELRHSIAKLADNFNSMLKNPKEGKYVSKEFVVPVINLLQAVNIDTYTENTLNRLEEQINNETDEIKRNELLDKYTSMYANTEQRMGKLSEKISEISSLYKGMLQDEDYAVAHDPVIQALIDKLVSDLNGTSLYSMNLEQLQETKDTMNAVMKSVRDATKMLGMETKERTFEVGARMMDESSSVSKRINGYVLSHLSPVRAFKEFGGYTKGGAWETMADMLNDGQRKTLTIKQQCCRIFSELTNNKMVYDLSDTKKLIDIGLRDEEGNSISITRGMMLSIYMSLSNKANRKHIMYGGMTVPDMKQYYNGKTKDSYTNGTIIHGVGVELADISRQLDKNESLTANQQIELKKRYKELMKQSEATMDILKKAIENELTDYEKEWIEKSKYFFNEYSKNNINDTTMELYGFKKARVEEYYPIHSDKSYVDSTPEAIRMDKSLENMGFLKTRTFSSNPVYLEDLTNVIDNQIDQVSKFCGMAIPLRNFQKCYEVKYQGYANAVTKTVEQKLGKSSKSYIENLLADLNGTKPQTDGVEGFVNRVKGNAAQAVLSINLGVTLKQAASFPTAASEVGWEALGKALVRGGKNNMLISRADRAIIDEYSPLLWYRNLGNSTTELGDLKSMRHWYDRNKTASKIENGIMGWIQKMDTATVGRLWYASQYWVDSNNAELKAGIDEYNNASDDMKITEEMIQKKDAYYIAVADKFNKIVELTQPNYTTMQRPGALRSHNPITKIITMFKTQLLQNMNILYDSAREYTAWKKDFKDGKNGVTATDVKEKQKQLGHAVSSQVVANLVIAGVNLLWGAIRHSMKNYKDDDDEITAESISEQMIKDVISSFSGYLIGGSEVYSLLDSWISGSTYYGISMTGIDTIQDAVDDLQSALSYIKDGNTSKIPTALHKLCMSISTCFGLPTNNIVKLEKGIRLNIIDIMNDDFLKFKAGETTTASKMAKAIGKSYLDGGGDTEQLDELLSYYQEDIRDKYPMYTDTQVETESKKKAATALNSYFKAQYLAGNDATRKNIESAMYNTGLYADKKEIEDKTLGWIISNLKDQYLKASSADERKEIRKQLYATHKWNSVSDMDKTIKGWTN